MTELRFGNRTRAKAETPGQEFAVPQAYETAEELIRWTRPSLAACSARKRAQPVNLVVAGQLHQPAATKP